MAASAPKITREERQKDDEGDPEEEDAEERQPKAMTGMLWPHWTY
jgi:hypothetical protein